MSITILDHRDKQDLEDKIDNLTCTENTGLDFVFGLTDNKKMSIRTLNNNTIYLDIEIGCWLRFDSKITGRVHTTKEELAEQLGNAFSITSTNLIIELKGQQSLVFDVKEKIYRIVGNQNLEYNYVIILGANNINVFGAAVTIANFDKLRNFNISLTEAEINSCKEYASLFVSTEGRTEPFIFFTDPHMATKQTAEGDLTADFEATLDRIKSVYNHTPTKTCICGGDWLKNGNSKNNAAWVLGKIDSGMKERFDKYINILGNHDTNYQGENSQTLGNAQCILSNTVLANLWYSEYGSNYFSVDGSSTKFYVFDTGIDSVSSMDAYRWEQVDWFANSLIKDNPERSAILLHIGTKNYVATPLVDYLTQVASAFNSKGQLTLNGVTYNFASATGKLYFALAGHAHLDMDFVQNTIPVVLTTNLFNDEVAGTTEPTYDLVLADYGANKLHCVRVGTGSSRTFDMA